MKIIPIRAVLVLLLCVSPRLAASAPERDSRISAIQLALSQAGLDGWLFFDFRGSDPLAYRVLLFDAKEAITTRRWYYWIPARGEPMKLVHAIEEGRLDALPGKKTVYLGWEERRDRIQSLLKGMKRVAMDYSPMNDIPTLARVDAGTVEFIRSLGVDVVSSGDLISRFESVWTPAQLASHRDAAAKLHRYVQEAFTEVAASLRAGTAISERDVQLSVLSKFKSGGLVEHPPIVAVNGNAANPHYEPTAERSSPIKPGDVLLIDISTKLASGERPVYADITWMAFCGKRAEIPAEVQQVWSIVREARDAALATVKAAFAGNRPVTGAELDDVARGVVKKAGHGAEFIHRTGHNIGEEVHGSGTNLDDLESRDTRRIVRKSCFSIEPGIYLTGRFGVRSEIDVYVGDDGVEVTGGEAQREIVALLE